MIWKRFKKILSLLSFTKYQKLLTGKTRSSLFLTTYRWWNEQLTPIGKAIFMLWFLFCIPATTQMGKPAFFICVVLGVFNTINYMVAYFFVHLKVEIHRNHPITAFAGDAIEGQIQIKNIGLTDLRDIELFEREVPIGITQEEVPFIKEVRRYTTLNTPYQILVNQRGVYHLKSILVTTSYPFGIIRKIKAKKCPQTITVFPKIIPLNFNQTKTVYTQLFNLNLHRRNIEENEYIGNREYSYGDRYNDLDHKAWGRTGYPITRVYQNDFENHIGIVFIPDYNNLFEEDAYENSLSLIASLLNELKQRKATYSFLGQFNGKYEVFPFMDEPEKVYDLLATAKKEKINLIGLKTNMEDFLNMVNYLFIVGTSITHQIIPEILAILPADIPTHILLCVEGKTNPTIDLPNYVQISYFSENAFKVELPLNI